MSALLIDEVAKCAKTKDYSSIQVSIAPENITSYNAFKSYVVKKGYTMQKISELKIVDTLIDFKEEEDLYEIVIQ